MAVNRRLMFSGAVSSGYEWHFDRSLSDIKQGRTAVLNGDFILTAAGIQTAATGYINLNVSDFKPGMFIEVDLVATTQAASDQSQTTSLIQLLSDNDLKGLTFGFHGSSSTTYRRFGIIATQDVPHWGYSTQTYTALNVIQSGVTRTVRIEVTASGEVRYYNNGIYYATDYDGVPVAIVQNEFIKNVVIGGKITYTTSFYNAVISAVRIGDI